jgi:hypothetical protein
VAERACGAAAGAAPDLIFAANPVAALAALVSWDEADWRLRIGNAGDSCAQISAFRIADVEG